MKLLELFKPKRRPLQKTPEPHGSKIRSEAVGYSVSALEEFLKSHPEQYEKLVRVVHLEIASRAFGLSNLRLAELKKVKCWLSRRSKT